MSPRKKSVNEESSTEEGSKGERLKKWCTTTYVCDSLKEIKADMKNILKLLTSGIPVTIRLYQDDGTRKVLCTSDKVPVVKLSPSAPLKRARAPPEGIEIIVSSKRSKEAGTTVSNQKEPKTSLTRTQSAPQLKSDAGDRPKRRLSAAPKSPARKVSQTQSSAKRKPSSSQAAGGKRSRKASPSGATPAKASPARATPSKASSTKASAPKAKRAKAAPGKKGGKGAMKTKKPVRKPKAPVPKNAGKRNKRGKGQAKEPEASASKIDEVKTEPEEEPEEPERSDPNIVEIQNLRQAKTRPNPPRKKERSYSKSISPAKYKDKIEKYRKQRKKEKPNGIEWTSPDWGKINPKISTNPKDWVEEPISAASATTVKDTKKTPDVPVSQMIQIRTRKFGEDELDVASAWFWNMCCVS